MLSCSCNSSRLLKSFFRNPSPEIFSNIRTLKWNATSFTRELHSAHSNVRVVEQLRTTITANNQDLCPAFPFQWKPRWIIFSARNSSILETFHLKLMFSKTPYFRLVIKGIVPNCQLQINRLFLIYVLANWRVVNSNINKVPCKL